jgi:branched-chain amino acid aminotransferase
VTTVVWHAGHILAQGEAGISPLNHGFTVGDGVYETLSVRHRQPFALTRHLARLSDALARTGLGTLHDETVREGVVAVMEAGEGRLTRLRITLTSGVGVPGLQRTAGPLTMTIMGSEGTRLPTCSAIRVPWRRNEYSPLVGVKTTSSGENALMYAYATAKGADEAVLGNSQGDLCEAISANVFVEADGEILTPPLASGCLPGVARALALEWGVAAGIPVRLAREGELPYLTTLDRVASRAAAMAITSATRGVQQVTVLDGVDVVPGALLGQLKVLWEQRADADPDPAPLAS